MSSYPHKSTSQRSFQSADQLYWELEKLRRDARAALAKSWQEIEILEQEKTERELNVRHLQSRCESLEKDLLAKKETTKKALGQQPEALAAFFAARNKPSSRRHTTPPFFPRRGENEDRHDDQEDEYSLELTEDNKDRLARKGRRALTSSMDLSLHLSKIFSTRSLFGTSSCHVGSTDTVTTTTESASSCEAMERRMEQLQEQREEQNNDYEQKIKIREESIWNLEQALDVKEQIITSLRNELERVQISTHIQKELRRIHDSAFNAGSDMFE